MTRILFVGDLRPHTRSSQRRRALVELGSNLRELSFVGLESSDVRPRSFLARVRSRLGLHDDPEAINGSVLENAASFDPEVLWVEKALCLRPSTLREFRGRYPEARVVFFSDDDMFARHNQSVWFRRCLELYDVVFTTKSHNAHGTELPSMGARRVVFFPKTFDPALHRPLDVTPADRERLGATIGFIGTYEEHRARVLVALGEAGIPVRVWGNGWERLVGKHPGLSVEGRAVYGEDYVKSVCATTVNLGFLRKRNRDQHTDRSVEIPACGACLLAERSDEHRSLFVEDKEAVFFGGTGELIERATFLASNPEEAARIGEAGRKRCLESDYSHHAALRRMLSIAMEDAA